MTVAAMMVTLVMVISSSYTLLSQLGFAVYSLLSQGCSESHQDEKLPALVGNIWDWQATKVGLKSSDKFLIICIWWFWYVLVVSENLRSYHTHSISYRILIIIYYRNHRTCVVDWIVNRWRFRSVSPWGTLQRSVDHHPLEFVDHIFFTTRKGCPVIEV